MTPSGRDDGRRGARPRLLTGSEARQYEHEHTRREHDLVFDFTGLNQPDVCDLALILTARLRSAPGDRVWVRALPYSTWSLLRSLRVDHLFHLYPAPGDDMN
jgi:hypothetical protein